MNIIAQIQQKSRFYTYFEDFASKYSKYRRRFKYYTKEIVSYCNYYISDDESVLEIGCGTGEVLEQLRGHRKVGIDYSPQMIKMAKEMNEGIDFHVMCAEDIQLDQKFDVIVN